MKFWKSKNNNNDSSVQDWIASLKKFKNEGEIQKAFDLCVEALNKLNQGDLAHTYFRAQKGDIFWQNGQYSGAENDYVYGCSQDDEYSIYSLALLYLDSTINNYDSKLKGGFVNPNTNYDYYYNYNKNSRIRDACILANSLITLKGEKKENLSLRAHIHLTYAKAIFSKGGIDPKKPELFMDLVLCTLIAKQDSFKIENSKYNSALTYYIIGNSSELLSYLPSLLDKNIESRGLYSQGLGGNYIEDDDSAEIAGVLIESQQEIKNAIKEINKFHKKN